MPMPLTKLVPAVLVVFACAAQAQQTVTLGPAATPKVLTSINGWNVQATGPGTLSFTIDNGCVPPCTGSGTVTITPPPASFTAMDYGSYLTYSGLAPFSGQATWTSSDPQFGVFFSVGGSLEQCNLGEVTNGAFACRVASPLTIENVNGQRLAYFDGYLSDGFFQLAVRMYFQVGSSSCPASTGAAGRVGVADCSTSVMEAVQVTQSFPADKPSYKLPLIAGKTTTIRMYPIQPDSGFCGMAGAKIDVRQSATLIGTLISARAIPPQLIIDRNSETSFDFKIPGAWTTKGDLTVTGTFSCVDGVNGHTPPSDPTPVTLQFQNQAKTPFSVVWVEACAPTDISPETPICPSATQAGVTGTPGALADTPDFLRGTYPVADDGITYNAALVPPLKWKGQLNASGAQAFLNHLRRFYILYQAAVGSAFGLQFDQLVAWIPYDPLRTQIVADPPYLHPQTNQSGSFGHVTGIAFHDDVEDDYALAHAIGHNLGLRHPNTSNIGTFLPDPKSCFPYSSSNIQNPGYDSLFRLLQTTDEPDFMGYRTTSSVWLAPYTYDILVRGGFQPQNDSINAKPCGASTITAKDVTQTATPQAGQETLRPATTIAATDFVIVSGTVSQDGSGTLAGFSRISSSAMLDQSDASGAYCIDFNSGATTLASFCFNASFTTSEGGALTTESFAFLMPFPSQTGSIVLLKQGVQIASVTVSKNAPVINITSPKAGDTWNPGTHTISWTSSDADGDPLMYTLLYSSDGGNSYIPIDLDLSDTQFTLDPSTIKGGSQVYFRVIASDGINTTTATAGPITVNQTPKVTASATSFPIGNASSSSVATAKVTLISGGSGPVTITSAAIDNSAFTIIDPPMPLIIPAGRRASLTVQFTPPANVQGVQSGTITVVSNDPLSPLKVPVTGMAFKNPVPNAVVAPPSLSFIAPAGQTQDRTISVSNTGGANLSVSSVSLAGANFALIGVQTPITVLPNTLQPITVRFTAPASGAPTGTVTVNTNDPTNPSIQVMLGGAVIPGAVLSITKTHTGNFRVSQQGATYTVLVSNTGAAATSGTVTVTDTIPSGLTLVSMAGTGWSCSTNTCTRSDALSPGSSYPAITVTVNVASNASTQVTNVVSVSGGGAASEGAADVTAIPQALGFFPIAPCRMVDTRASQNKTGAFGPPALGAFAGRDFPLLGSTCTINPAAKGYSLNFTVVPPGNLDFLSAWPSGQPYPGVSTLNSPDGSVIANAALLPAGNSGNVTVVTGEATDLIIDANGYFAPPNGQDLAFYTVTPCRIVDTRSGQGKSGAFGPPSLGAYAGRDFPIANSCGVPASAKAFSLNMTVVPTSHLDFLSTWPAGQAYPGVSTLNSSDGSIIANAAIVPSGNSGSITVLAGNPTDLIVDINGYFAPPGSPGALHFYPLPPCRIADTRAGQGKTGAFGPPSLAAYSGRNFPLQSSACNIPATAQAYSLNLTAIPQGHLDFLSMWPTGQPYPGVSTLNSPKGTIVANAAIVPAGSGGAITVLAGNPTDLIIDINGYFAP